MLAETRGAESNVPGISMCVFLGLVIIQHISMKSGLGDPVYSRASENGNKRGGPLSNKEHLRGLGSAEGSLGVSGGSLETLGSRLSAGHYYSGPVSRLSLSWSVLEMQSTLSS